MKIPTINNAREADAFTVENEPITSVDLMERAATTAFNWIENRLNIQSNHKIMIFCGMGNNGGDGFVLGRLFCRKHYDVEVFLVHVGEKMSHDCQVNHERLKALDSSVIRDVFSKNDFPEISDSDVVIDAMFGSGLTRPLEGLAAEMVEHLNNNRRLGLRLTLLQA